MNLTDHETHASNVILYAPVLGKPFSKYNMKYAMMVCVCLCSLCVCIGCVSVCIGCVCVCVCVCVRVCVCVCVWCVSV